ncbi:hypothetical protein [Streptomyces sp. NPDC056144]|uniref:hypothetical protein n=1 Tax=unclassified Streptomyces TaxID=2593676 RepID=UPI0035DD43B1
MSELDIIDAELLPVGHETHPLVHNAADHELSPETVEALKAAIPPETYRKYDFWLKKAEVWCTAMGRTYFPMTTETLTEWIRVTSDTPSDKTRQPYGASALGQAVAAILAAHTWARVPVERHPDPRPARLLIKAHKKRLADTGRRVKKSATVDIDGFAAMVQQCDTTTLRGLRDRLIAVWSVWAMTRRKEFAARVIPDVVVVPRKGVRLFFASSKTDQAAEGEWVTMPRRDDLLDPVTSWTEYRDALAAVGITDGAILRRIDRWGNVGEALSAESVNDIIQALAEKAGVLYDENGLKLTAHGARASGATIADENGASGAAIRKQGRWSPNSKVADGYIRPRDEWDGNAMAKIPTIPAPRTEPA